MEIAERCIVPSVRAYGINVYYYENIVKEWIYHYNDLYTKKLQNIESSTKKAKYRKKKRECLNIVLKAIKKNSLIYHDKRKLKIRLWPKKDKLGNKLYDEKGVVQKIERYDIITFLRLLVEAKNKSDEVFYQFLSLYDVRKIIENINEDYFGDLELFLSRDSL